MLHSSGGCSFGAKTMVFRIVLPLLDQCVIKWLYYSLMLDCIILFIMLLSYYIVIVFVDCCITVVLYCLLYFIVIQSCICLLYRYRISYDIVLYAFIISLSYLIILYNVAILWYVGLSNGILYCYIVILLYDYAIVLYYIVVSCRQLYFVATAPLVAMPGQHAYLHLHCTPLHTNTIQY